ncbi:MAG: hypothetical protein EBX52_08065 [Proteobacteria bacterium]|nr:hypothetical protein [Pseudomonadota bacterium]
MANPLERTLNDLIRSLLFHERIPSGVDGLFRAMGVVHLFTASGIHLLALFFWLGLLAKHLGLHMRLPVRRVRSATLLVFLAISFLVWKSEGFHPSLFRPLLSILVRSGLRQAGFRTPVLLPLGVVFLFEELIRIRTGLDPGAVHYYLAVAGSLIALARSEKKEKGLLLHFRMAVYSWLPIALLDLWRDHRVVPSTPILSLITIPPVSLVLYPITLMAQATSGEVPDAVKSLWRFFLVAVEKCIDLLPGGFSVSPREVWIGLIGAAMIAALAKRMPRALIPAALGICSLRFLVSIPLADRIIQLDVGQGDSAILQKAGRTEMVDLGSLRIQNADRMLRSLSRYGVGRVEGVLFSHLDEDHIGALPVLLALAPVGCLEMGRHHQEDERGKKVLDWLLEHHPEIRVSVEGCIHNARVAWFGSDRSGAHGNEWMAGLASSNHERVYLALGDGDVEQERTFLKVFESEIRSHSRRIWKVGHHGSRFSSDPQVLAWMHPDELWISVGSKNRYHHPAPVTLARLAMLSGTVRRTDQEGDLVMGSTE